MVGQTLGHFRITGRLGSGGMGIVYRAHDEKLHRTVAIKVIERDTGVTLVDRARIVEEARASSALSHPNICTVYEIGEINGQAYIAMEYVEGPAAVRQLGQARFNGWNYPFAISPDGKAIATSNSRHISDEIWLIEPSKRQ